MATFEEEIRLKEVLVPVAADQLFSRPLFRLPRFLITMALGIVAIGLDIWLDVAAWKGPKMLFGLLAVVGCIVVSTWFAVPSHLEDLRASYVNETGSPEQRGVALSDALMSDFRVALGGLTTLYVTVILLLEIVWHLLMGAAH